MAILPANALIQIPVSFLQTDSFPMPVVSEEFRQDGLKKADTLLETVDGIMSEQGIPANYQDQHQYRDYLRNMRALLGEPVSEAYRQLSEARTQAASFDQTTQPIDEANVRIKGTKLQNALEALEYSSGLGD